MRWVGGWFEGYWSVGLSGWGGGGLVYGFACGGLED